MIDLEQFSRTLMRDDRGIWVSGSGGEVSYPEHGHGTCHAVEDSSFWFHHRNHCILAAVRRHPPAGPIFDIGGGNGYVARALVHAGWDVVLVEPGGAGASHARDRGLEHVVCATLDSAGFARQSLPAVGLFDVVEHIQDDSDFLRRLAELIVPGGWIYLTVPAYPALWSAEDVDAGHFRRYTRSTLGAAASRAGFRIYFSSMIFRPLPLPILLSRTLPYRMGLRTGTAKPDTTAREHAVRGGLVASIVAKLLARELTHIQTGSEMAFGASILMVARLADAHGKPTLSSKDLPVHDRIGDNAPPGARGHT